MKLSLWIEDKEHALTLKKEADGSWLTWLDESELRVGVEFLNSGEMLLNIDGKVYDVLINGNGRCYSVSLNGESFTIEKRSVAQRLGAMSAENKTIDVKTSMPGRIVKILALEGEEVREDQPVLILEAMKMQNEIKSPKTGILTRVIPEVGQIVESNSILFTVD